MAQVKFGDMPELADTLATDDLIAIKDASAGTSKYVQYIQILERATEVHEAIRTCRLVYNSANTIDIQFPYLFSDGNTWATISGVSTATTGKTNTNIYWLGVYIDLTAKYASGTAPTSGNISIAWSSANNTEPTRPSNSAKLGVYIRGIGDAGGDVDISRFIHAENRRYMYNGTGADLPATATLNTTQSVTTTVYANQISPAARVIHGLHTVTLNDANARVVTGQLLNANSEVMAQTQAQGSPSAGSILGLSTTVRYPLYTTQTIKNYGVGNNGAACNLTSHTLNITGYEE